MQTRFILVRPLPVPTSSPQATHLRFSTIFVKIFYYRAKREGGAKRSVTNSDPV